MNDYYVYILTNVTNKVLYIGVTNDLAKRIYEHKMKFVDGFAEKYNTNKLVYFETTPDVYSAISREKQLKKWNRAKKDNLISSINPAWRDLGKELDIVDE